MGIILPILQIGLGAITAFAQIGAANAQYQAQLEASNRQIEATYEEVARQQEEVNRVSQEQVSDRIKKANLELGTVRVLALERGVSGTTMIGLARHIGYLEGVDLSRIEKNREGNIEAGEAAKKNAQNRYFSEISIAANQKRVATTSAILGAVGSGLQIAGGYYQDQMYLKSLENSRVAYG
jgi:hypothetical protein